MRASHAAKDVAVTFSEREHEEGDFAERRDSIGVDRGHPEAVRREGKQVAHLKKITAQITAQITTKPCAAVCYQLQSVGNPEFKPSNRRDLNPTPFQF